MNKKYEHIKSEIVNNIVSITLNRPNKKNALNPKMIHEFQEVLNIYQNNPSIRIILISSSSNTFCAGADIEYLEKISRFSYEENLEDSKKLMSLFKTMLHYPKLIISKVCGAALGGGCGIMTASDLVFATNDSKFGYPEVKIGFTPALVSTFLIERINISNTRKLLLTGEIIDAKKGKNMGLINYLCTKKNITNEINNFIEKFTNETSPDAIHSTKKTIYSILEMDRKLEKAAKINAKARMNEDFKKGIQAFLNKTSINWNKI